MSSPKRSFAASGECEIDGEKGDEFLARIEGGSKEGGRVDGISVPASFF